MLTVSPSTTNTPNRFWKDNSAGIQLRVYGGTLTFEVPEGSSDITKIVFNNGRWNAGNAADSGELDANATWTGSAQKVVVSIAGNTQLNSIAVTVGEEEPFNIVELIKITPEEGEVESLQNFQITFGDYAVTVNEDAVPTLTNTDTEAVLDGGIGLSDDGKTVFVDFDSEATEAGTYRLDIPENSIYYEGVALDPLVFTYTVKGEEAPEYTIDPEEGEVESLSAFTITFNKYLVDADSDVAVAFLINTDTEEEVAGTVYAIAGGRQAYISLEREVTEAGEYELIVADGALQKTIDDSFLPELSFSYTIVAAPITLDFNLVEVPEDAVVEEYLFSAYDPYYEEVVTRNIQVATSGNDVYFNGVTEILPEGWIKGVRTGNTVTFDAAQYLGVYYYYGIYPYHFWFNADGKVTFQYDEAKDEYTTAYYTTLMYDEDDEEDPYYIYDEYEDIVITRIIEVAATPADPEITSVESTTYGDVLEFNIPVEDVDGNPLIASNLFYQVFSDVERVVTPVTFTPDYFEYLTDDLTEIPYGFTENWDFYNGTIYLNLDHDDWNKVGLQSIYYGGGEVNKSNIVWYDIKDYTTDGITGVNAADEANAKYFDLQGRQVNADTKGVIIRQVVDANGKVSVSKIVRK